MALRAVHGNAIFADDDPANHASADGTECHPHPLRGRLGKMPYGAGVTERWPLAMGLTK